MRDSIERMEERLKADGRQVEREYVFEELNTRDGAGWIVRVEGDTVASAASLGGLEVALREWIDGAN